MLDPQAKALLDLMVARGVPPTHTLAPVQARRFYVERRAATQPPARPLGEVRDLVAPGPQGDIPLRLYRPDGLAEPAPPFPIRHLLGTQILTCQQPSVKKIDRRDLRIQNRTF